MYLRKILFSVELSSEISQYYSAVSDVVSLCLRRCLSFNWSSCKYLKCENKLMTIKQLNITVSENNVCPTNVTGNTNNSVSKSGQIAFYHLFITKQISCDILTM